MWEIKACKVLVGKLKGKRRLGTPRRREKTLLRWILVKYC
jgi:hypothetical protein